MYGHNNNVAYHIKKSGTRKVFFLAALVFCIPLFAQNSQRRDPNQNKNIKGKKKEVIRRMIQLESLGTAFRTGDGKYKNTRLIRFIKYIAKENKTGQFHRYEFYDGDKYHLANNKPDKCVVTNVELGIVVDAYNSEQTCEQHFGENEYRKPIQKLVTYYANYFVNSIKNKKGLLTVSQTPGTKDMISEKPGQIVVTLHVDGISFTAVATLKNDGTIEGTHSFFVEDPSINNPDKGMRKITITSDYSPEIFNIIKNLCAETVKITGIRNGTRKDYIANSNDILSQF
ncbi:MAG: hypothetical protein D6767_11085 [Candidatus Hydrogenedentota bacterium]|nr:MAG: hypothetical protein D6767_11085 [Candidatus Hydrogenedentota bacterium]